MTTSRMDAVGDGVVDDLGDGISFGLEEIDETIAEMVAVQAEERPRDGELITLRLGLDGERPETLMLLGVRYELSRDRVRQVYTRAIGQIIRRVRATGVPDTAVFAERYPVGWGDERLVRTLLAETYATDADIAAQDLAYLKLRLAGHALLDAKRIAGFVFQRIAGWQQRGRWHPAEPRQLESVGGQLVPLLRRVDWPTGSPAALPSAPIATLDADDDARGSMFTEKLGREAGFDTALEARLLRMLDQSEQVATFVERPAAIEYRLDGARRTHYPTVAARLADGRVVLIDVVPLARVGVHGNRVKLAAARAWAHERGWGWLVFTGSRLGEPELAHHGVDPRHENLLRNRLAAGPMTWAEFRRYVDDTGIDVVDLAAMTLRHGWRWERGPFRLARDSTATA
ncbi:hypothetical protein NDR87_14365 [Nocardia sp. CDC159]|uniref:Sigma-70-like protein n=1 Tax=Nocardia pulmonis TaxID=2951408 RepID=A0A9X2E681_9NOCA|nr:MULTISPECIES: hypothetical protein [Nocardia]MCM6774395.1 hypothetical protein [Nocardia pulmonis]MCM6787539.1 hypothetical protein [Nocardia sp. CDC159]